MLLNDGETLAVWLLDTVEVGVLLGDMVMVSVGDPLLVEVVLELGVLPLEVGVLLNDSVLLGVSDSVVVVEVVEELGVLLSDGVVLGVGELLGVLLHETPAVSDIVAIRLNDAVLLNDGLSVDVGVIVCEGVLLCDELTLAVDVCESDVLGVLL